MAIVSGVWSGFAAFVKARPLATLLGAAGIAAVVFILGGYLGSRLAGGGAYDRIVAWFDERRDAAARRDGQLVWQEIQTTLHRVAVAEIELGLPPGRGGALAWLGDGQILYADGFGGFGLIGRDGEHHRLDFTAPMNREAFERAARVHGPQTQLWFFKVSDILVQPASQQGQFDLFVAHHAYLENEVCTDFVISAATLTVSDGVASLGGEGWRRVWTAKPCVGFALELSDRFFAGLMAGGRMAVDGGGDLLVSLGSQHYSKSMNAQEWRAALLDPNFAHAKVHRIDLETLQSEVVASGFRNPQGLLVDDQDRIWLTSLGPLGGDELNLVEPGKAYGWPWVTLGVDYGHVPWPFNERQGRHDGFEPPRIAWSPAIAPTQLVQLDGQEFPDWEGDLLIGALAAQSLIRVRLDGDRVMLTEALPRTDWRFRDLIVLPDGKLLAWTDDSNLLVIRNAERTETGAEVLAWLAPGHRLPRAVQTADAAPIEGRAVFEARCGSCHLMTDRVEVAPPLHNVFNRQVASYPGFEYSEGLAARSGQTWNASRLRGYLRDPSAMAPGGLMPNPNLSAGELDAVIDYLRNPADDHAT